MGEQKLLTRISPNYPWWLRWKIIRLPMQDALFQLIPASERSWRREWVLNPVFMPGGSHG